MLEPNRNENRKKKVLIMKFFFFFTIWFRVREFVFLMSVVFRNFMRVGRHEVKRVNRQNHIKEV